MGLRVLGHQDLPQVSLARHSYLAYLKPKSNIAKCQFSEYLLNSEKLSSLLLFCKTIAMSKLFDLRGGQSLCQYFTIASYVVYSKIGYTKYFICFHMQVCTPSQEYYWIAIYSAEIKKTKRGYMSNSHPTHPCFLSILTPVLPPTILQLFWCCFLALFSDATFKRGVGHRRLQKNPIFLTMILFSFFKKLQSMHRCSLSWVFFKNGMSFSLFS